MKTILVDAVNGFIIENQGKWEIFEEMFKLLESYPQQKIILTGAPDEKYELYGLNKVPYEVFTLRHNPPKGDTKYFKMMLEHFGLTATEVVYLEYNESAVASARSVGIVSHFYDKDKKDLASLKKFLDENL